MDIAIYNAVFLRRDGQPAVNIGGIETLISYLLPVIASLGWRAHVFQSADRPFHVVHGSADVRALPLPPSTPVHEVLARLRQEARSTIQAPHFVELFGADHFSIATDNPMAIAIQNGVWWDQPIRALTHKKLFWSPLGELVFRLRKQFQMLRLFENCPNHVCVDHNFINWYRTCRGATTGRIWVNPNPAPAISWDASRDSPRDVVRIIFARRFVPQKGTRLIAGVFRKLLAMRPNVRITFAGEGPDEGYLRQEFRSHPSVQLTSYNIQDVMKVLASHDITVIPSLLSEGTCLSVVEGMASGCAVVATNFGGMTNQIVDGYNGRLVLPDEARLLEALLELVDDHATRLRMQKRGWEVAQSSFSLAQWERRWAGILREVGALAPAR